ncbi:hypothetical protein EW145_g879 [Phellinidium pouzarii]|uniref:Uncharacterized protein n=1 Tax=Phellinidium pouzarii TaxID=167371 RepID=A0A4S4LGW6_9AGAM|nr:hypothetical protein EW145_g879 [Phellinidium pouzarii]
MPPNSDPSKLRKSVKEKARNVSWLAKMLSSTSSCKLTRDDLVDFRLQSEIADFGQIEEAAHGSVDPKLLWSHLDQLEGYVSLKESEHGEVPRIYRVSMGDSPVGRRVLQYV